MPLTPLCASLSTTSPHSVKPALTVLKMGEPALFFVGVFVLPYVVGAALFPFLLLFFYLKEKLYDA